MPGPGRGLGPRGFLTEEEKQNLPKVSGALIRRILGYLKPYWLQFLLVFVTILLSAVVGLLPSIRASLPDGSWTRRWWAKTCACSCSCSSWPS